MAIPSISDRLDCRICGSTSLERWVHLPQMPLTDDLRTDSYGSGLFLSDIDVWLCLSCGVSQTKKVIDMGHYYKEYSYSVANSGFANRFMDNLAERIMMNYHLPEPSTVIEVGSGDGQQLSYFQKRGADVFGFEPSSELCRRSESNGIPVFQGLFTKDSVRDIPSRYRNANILLLTYTFDHIPEPMEFLHAAKQLIDPDQGVLVIEVHDLDKIVQRREYCLFEHEHFIYCTRESMGEILRRGGFELLTTELLPESERRGNSLLVVAAPMCSSYAQGAHSLVEPSTISYETFDHEIKAGIKRLDDFIRKQIKAGKKVAGYGAGGRGVMTMAAMESASLLSYVCDGNSSFHGLYTPKSGVLVTPPTYLEEEPVDVLLVFSFGYLQEIKETVSRMKKSPREIVSMLEVL